MRVLTILVAILLALAAAGCGGDDDAASDTDTVVTETTDTTTTDETTTDDEGTETGGIDAAGCHELLGAVAAFSQALGGSGGGEDVASVFDEFLDDVPADIRADLETLANAYSTYLDELEGLGIEPGETPDADDIAALQQAAAALDDPDVAAASQRISTWTAQNCTG